MKKPYLLLFTLILIMAGCDRQDETMPRTSTPLYLHYSTSSESSYTDIKLQNDQLTYTYFVDDANRCAQWFKSEPCWQESDLHTITLTVDPATEEQLRHLLTGKDGLLALAKNDFGANNPRQRAYTERLEVKNDQTERKLTYRSRPDADPMPEAFAQVTTLLRKLAEQGKTQPN